MRAAGAWGRGTLVGCLATTVLFASALAASPASAQRVVDVPVAFKVKNTNTSGMPCPRDGTAYTVRGRLVGPRSALRGRGRHAATLYLHGFNVGAYMWRLPGFRRLDAPRALAKLGHVSIVVDELGYDRSDHPNGTHACLGSQADVTHQIIGLLRHRRYSLGRRRPTAFQRIVLAGHDAGAVIADIELYSYHDADALVHMTWADQGFTNDAITGFGELLPTCAAGGHPAEQGPPARRDPAGGPSGYEQFLTDAKIRYELSRDNSRAVVDRVLELVNRNPCGEYESVPEAVQLNQQRLPEIQVPILYGYGGLEFLWTQDGLAQETQYFRGSRDVTTVVFRRSGHFPQFSSPRAFQRTLAKWLRRRGA